LGLWPLSASDDGNDAHITLESLIGAATKTNLKPLRYLPLRLIVPRV